VLWCLAVCCSVLQCVLVFVGKGCVLQSSLAREVSRNSAPSLLCGAVCCSVLQCVAVYCSVLQCVVVCCSVREQEKHHEKLSAFAHKLLQRVAVCL